ncbi:hypothetical protein M9Y10_033205 [Tritrichomonas musculus]|uniref:RING-type domain-containing protein n=1 Tax=Tritrichomonas musculus TaxID=1915356 RepID=A0ABR2GXB0_9EUKA
MSLKLLEYLDESNSIKDEFNQTITITSPVLNIEGNVIINDPSYKITSNCDTIIKCENFEVETSYISISNINFEGSVLIKNSDNISIKNSYIKKSKGPDGCLFVYGSKNVTLSHLTITESSYTGLCLRYNSKVQADNLEIYGIAETLLVCNSGSTITVTDSKFYNGKANGCFSTSYSPIEIINCTFSGIDYPAIYIENSPCTIKNCSIKNIDQDGIAIHASKNFLIEKNEFTLINNSAISIADESHGEINENIIYDVSGNGIYTKKSELTIRNNEISNTKFPAIAIIIKSKASLFDNKVKNMIHNGIVCRGASDVRIEGSVIEDINEGGISVSDTEKCEIVKNTIKNCSIMGIEVFNKSNVFAEDNNIMNMKKYAFLVYTSGYIKSEKNSISDVSIAMAKLAFKGRGDFTNNYIVNCPNQCEIQTSSPFLFAGNGDFKGITNQIEKVTSSISIENSYVEPVLLCFKCNKNPRDCYILDCGHKIFCQSCAKKALENKENCPLCRFPIKNVSSGFGISKDDICIICLENHPDCIILPCGHMGACSKCLENWFEKNQSCPICRAENSVYKIIGQDM